MNTHHSSKSTQLLISLITGNNPVSAAQIGWIVSELIKREQAPGGPYTLFDDPQENTAINEKIAAFISRLSNSPSESPHIEKRYSDALQHRYQEAQKYIHTLPQALRKPLLPIFYKIKSTDIIGEIGLLSTLFYDSLIESGSDKTELNTEVAVKAHAQLAEQLDIANILVWTSYTLYDDAIDNPSPQSIQSIPAATAILRCAQSIFHNIDGVTIANNLLTEVDCEMTKESQRNTSPQPTTPTTLHGLQKAMGKKSIAHIAGPLILASRLARLRTSAPIIASASTAPEQDSVAKLYTALERYCAARQLLDDLYDWQEDFANKQFTYANIQITEKTTSEGRRSIKRRLMKEVLTASIRTTRDLEEFFAQIAPPFTSTSAHTPMSSVNRFVQVTVGKITTTAQKALDYDTATSESLASYTKSIYRN